MLERTSSNETRSWPMSDRGAEALILLACGLFYSAVAFTLWDWPSVDGFPAIERYLDSGFLTNDFYTNTGTGYSVDTVLAIVFGGLENLTGVSYIFWLGAMNLLRCLTWPWCLFLLFRALSNNREIGLIGAILGTLSMFQIPNLLAWAWVWGDPSTAMFAVSLIVLAWVTFLHRTPWLSMVLMAAAAMFHPLMVVHGGVFIALIYFVDFTRDEKIKAILSPANMVGGVIFAGAFAFQYIALSSGADDKIAVDTYAHIIAHERHPGDFLPSLFSLGEWAEAGLACLLAGVILVVRKADFPRWRLVVSGLAFYAVICVCGWLFVEIWPVRFFVDLIPFRNVILGAPLILFVYAVFAAREFSRSRYVSFLGTLLFFYLYTKHHWFGVSSGLMMLALSVWVLANIRGLRAITKPVDAYIVRKLGGDKALLVIAVLILALSVPILARRLPQIAPPSLENQHPVYQWLETQTPIDSIILLDQFAGYTFSRDVSPQKMRLVARRAVVASKDFPFLDRDILPWYERWSVALGHGELNFINRANASELDHIADAFAFDYVLRNQPLEPHSGYQIMAQFTGLDGWANVYVYSRLLEREALSERGGL